MLVEVKSQLVLKTDFVEHVQINYNTSSIIGDGGFLNLVLLKRQILPDD